MKSFALLSLLATALFTGTAMAEIVVYTDRPTARLQPAGTRFEELTGEKVVFVEAAYPDLAKRLELEGAETPADLLIAKDIVFLADATGKGFFQSMQLSPAVERVAPAMRESSGKWVALTYRARTLAYDPQRVNAAEIENYEDLAQDKWAGRLCLRTSKGSYNESLTSFLLAKNGTAGAKSILEGWIANLAAPVFPNDTSLLEAIAAGTCDVGIVNHYYLAQLHALNPNFPVKIKFLEQNKGGVHANGAGIGIVKGSKNAGLAQKFLELLLSDEFQLQISAGHLDYPAVAELQPSSLIKDWGTFKADTTPWSEIGTFVPAARALMKEVGYN